ncbi:FecR family protein [Ancylomarina sp. 16SWW S1-10-2]|uniref:FecR family protein n=1 Tax=Ancylomarina sp. 16SWW S1-10-2 TaxID=2499681 RepID=UPI0012AEAC4D|nr:FecR domain-containing protein [Ancylomarina sp. 16SWW S1-10-2]MRT93242.1 DUF4974 domain-containing protein [Ancylomarina sp. 16SWW S1-10-2]
MNKLSLDIIYKKLNERLSSSENEEFNLWINSSPKHKAYFEKVKNHKESHVEDLDIDSVEDTTDEFMSRLEKKHRVIVLHQILRYAAVILLPLIAGAYVLFFTNQQIEQDLAQVISNDVVSVRDQAVLITSSGKTYELENGAEESIVEEDGVNIRKYLKAGLKYEQKKSPKENKPAYNILRTSKGGEYQIELADGTHVHLNCGSELRYPVSFTGDTRKVELKGEAYFEVVKNGKPFFVEVEDMTIEVLGTCFNVMAYEDEETVQTTLLRGKVKVAAVKDGVMKSLFLEPGKQASWDNLSGELNSKVVKTELYTSWIDGYFRFEDQRLEDLMRNIARWYDVKVFYQNPELKNKRLTGKLYRFEDFNVIANMMEKISGVKMRKNKDAVVISFKE